MNRQEQFDKDFNQYKDEVERAKIDEITKSLMLISYLNGTYRSIQGLDEETLLFKSYVLCRIGDLISCVSANVREEEVKLKDDTNRRDKVRELVESIMTNEPTNDKDAIDFMTDTLIDGINGILD